MNNMKNHLFKRITALIMVFAMVLSMAGISFAADTSSVAALDTDLPDTSVVTPDPEEPDEDPGVDTTDDQIDANPVDTEEPEANTGDSSQPGEAEEVPETEEDENLLETSGTGWSYTSAGYKYNYLNENGTYSAAKDSYKKGNLYHIAYQIPKSTVTVKGKKVTIPEGIYFFDENGYCVQPSTIQTLSTKHGLDRCIYKVRNYDAATGVTGKTSTVMSVDFTRDETSTLYVGAAFNGGVYGVDGNIYFGQADGTLLSATGSYHWCDDIFCYYGTKNELGAIGTPYGSSYKFGSLPGKGTDFYETYPNLKPGVIYFFTKGVVQSCDGTYHWYTDKADKNKLKLCYFDKSASNGGFSAGTLYSGGKKLGSLPASLKGVYETGVVYYFSSGLPTKCDKTYHWYGQALYYFNNASSHKGYSVGTGYTGVRAITTLPASLTDVYKQGVYTFKNGLPTPYTGAYKTSTAKGMEYYKNGVKTKYTGWVKYNNKYYYFKNSTLAYNAGTSKDATTYLKGIGATGSTYRYTFKSDGSLVTNLFTYKTSYKASKMRIKIDNSTHNTIFLLYDSSKKAYDIAGLQVICSTPQKRGGSNGLAYGTYYLSTTRRWSWLRNTTQSRAYCYCTEIVKYNSSTKKYTTSNFMFHSPQYYLDAYKSHNYHRLVTANYNKFGASNTGGCVRLQTGYCSLVQQISKANKAGNVQVCFNAYNDKGPFGQVKNADIKIPASQNYDPTTPKSKL